MALSSKIFISGYPLTMNEMDLAQLVAPHGEIATVKIVRDKATRKPKGYAFIELISPEAASDVAAALNGAEMRDNTLTVNIVEDQPESRTASHQKAQRSREPFKKKRPRITR